MLPDHPDEVRRAYEAAANRLHHLSMRYVGALLEAATGKQAGLLPKDHPGLSECRDLIDCVLLCRAEINGLTQLLARAGVIDVVAMTKQHTEEYQWLTEQKAKFLGVEVIDTGLVFRAKD